MLRLAFVAVAGHTLSLQASGYDPYAVNLLAGHGYTRFDDLHPDSDLPPLYPFFLAGVYSVFGRSAVAVALVQIVFDVVTIAAIYAIGRRVGGERAGLLAAAFTGFYPYLLFQGVSVNDTTLFTMLLALGVWAVYRVWDTRSWRWAAFAGLMFGVAALTKTLVAVMLPLFALWWWRQLGFRRAFGLAAVMGFVFVAVLLPWVVRNTRLHGSLTLISTNDGSNLYQGNNPCVADYLLALQTKRFVILTGISGTGKTQLALSVARHFQPVVEVARPTAIPEGMFKPSANTVTLSAVPSPSVSKSCMNRMA